jgi:peptidoglycan-associated lipoprotein
MKGVKRLTAFLALLFISVNVMAQKNYAKDADKAFDNKQYYTAIELYKVAYTKEKNKEKKAAILFKTAESYRAIGDLKGEENYYNKAIKAKYPDPIAYLHLANAKKQQGKYDEALIEYQNYKKEVPSDQRGEDGAKSAELAQKWKDQPTRYKVENVAMINSKELDFSPCFADKKYKTLYFTSTREGVTGGSTIDEGTGKVFSDIFETKVDKNGKWSTPTPLAEPVNTAGNEGSSIVTVKGTTIFYTRCDVEKNEVKKCQLYMAAKKGNNWGDPAKLPFSVDSFAFRHPAINKDENVLVFASDMPGGQGGYDLWVSTKGKGKNSEWSTPVNLGPSINTSGHEFFPFIHEDGTLYFSSDGHIGMGGLDIFKAEKKGDAQWANVTNMRAPINSAGDDFGIIFEGAKERGYLSSNREGGKGTDDIYSFVLPPLVFKLEGVVTDCQNKVPVEAVTVSILGSDGYAQEVKTDKAGYYSVSLQPALSYVITTDAKTAMKTTYAEKYLNSSEKGKVTTVGEEESKTFKKDFCLTPATNEIRFPAVLYDLGKATLREESKDSLDFLYKTLIDNPTIVIELSAHTDSRAADNFNLKLSDARAKSCVDYLISKGIPAARLVPKGYGETKLLVKDAEINKLKSKEEQEAAHQKNRRTVFKVLRWDFVDPNAPKVAPPQIRPKVSGEEQDEETSEDGTGTDGTGTGTGTTQPNNTTTQPTNTGTQPNNTGTTQPKTGTTTQPNNTGTQPKTGTTTQPKTTQPNNKPK